MYMDMSSCVSSTFAVMPSSLVSEWNVSSLSMMDIQSLRPVLYQIGFPIFLHQFELNKEIYYPYVCVCMSICLVRKKQRVVQNKKIKFCIQSI